MGEIGYLFNLIFTYPIFNGLMLLYHLFGDLALSIIVLTVIIKLILFPLTLQQLKSMKATQALQPQMAEIRRKYAKDQQAQMQATQSLYKEYGVNPIAGCLPLLIQLPVLYGLFYALNNVLKTSKISEINALLYPFVPHFTRFPNVNLNWFTWINPAWHISLAVPDHTLILPILAGVATFVQLRMSQPKTAPGAPSDPSTQSMRMMQYIMPFVTVFFGLSFSAGLALYWTVSSTFQAVQQYFVTGWGSLLVTPNLHLGGSQSEKNSSNGSNGAGGAVNGKSYTGDRRREEALLRDAEGESEGEEYEDAGPVERNMRTASPPSGRGPSQYTRRRQRSSSASARRRSSTQRSRS